MIPIKSPGEILRMRAACRLSAQILAELAAQVRPGITTGELDAFAAARMQALGVRSAFLGYNGFPGQTCISLNEEVVHGIPGPRVINAAAAVDAARAGRRLGDVGHAVQSVAEAAGFAVVRDFCGHGVGRRLHEEPQIPNFGTPGKGPALKPGMTLAIEPMINAGGLQVEVMPDGWTVKTRDRRRSAHFEHTVLVVAAGPAEVLTCVEKK